VSDAILIAYDGPTATITLNRPDVHNSLRPEDFTLFSEKLDEAEARDGLRVVVVTGAGKKTFSAGFDIPSLAVDSWYDNTFGDLVDRLEQVKVPTVCALNGSVYGGAAELALACDIRIGVRGMRMFVGPAKLGIHYPISGLQRFVEHIGPGPTKRLFLTCETLTGDDLLTVGYLDHLVDPLVLEAKTKAKAQMIAELAPLSVKGMKYAIRSIARGDLDMDAARAHVKGCFESEDFTEGRSAFIAKRRATFKGR